MAATKKSLGERIFSIVNIVFLAFLMIVTIYPVWHVAMASISLPRVVANHRGVLLYPVGGFSLETYAACFKHPLLLISYRNTFFYVVFGTGINLVMTMLTAYVLAAPNLMHRRLLLWIMMFTSYFSGGMIPGYLLINSLGMNNTIWAILLPGAVSVNNVLITRSFIKSLPESLQESARIDGASELFILWKIILPLSAPVLAVMALYYGVGHWNSWFPAMIYLRDRNKHPLALVLREIVITGTFTTNTVSYEEDYVEWNATKETIKYGTIMIATIPIMCVYPFLQKYFAKGVMIGAIKG